MELIVHTSVVITSVQAPTASVECLHRALTDHHIPLIIVGDRKGPLNYPSWADFLHIDAQKLLPFRLAKILPEKHYARKNLGYLYAIQHGTECLYETDDDNAPLPNWGANLAGDATAKMVGGRRWVNVYAQFTDRNVWPRGLALDFIREKGQVLLENRPVHCPIRQGLANGSPDVDAIWRLTDDSDVQFEFAGPVALAAGVWCPFNSQNTWWFKEAFPLLYLPSLVNFRMTDIWRSFVAQRCLWAMGANLVFHNADVHQERNPHNLMRDFEDEVPGYLNNDRIAVALDGLKLSSAPADCGANLRACYERLIAIGVVPPEELPLIDAWLADIAGLTTS